MNKIEESCGVPPQVSPLGAGSLPNVTLNHWKTLFDALPAPLNIAFSYRISVPQRSIDCSRTFPPLLQLPHDFCFLEYSWIRWFPCQGLDLSWYIWQLCIISSGCNLERSKFLLWTKTCKALCQKSASTVACFSIDFQAGYNDVNTNALSVGWYRTANSNALIYIWMYGKETLHETSLSPASPSINYDHRSSDNRRESLLKVAHRVAWEKSPKEY